MTSADHDHDHELMIMDVAEDAEALVARVAAELITTIADRQDGDRVAQVCLTGGRIATRVYERLAGSAEPGSAGPGLAGPGLAGPGLAGPGLAGPDAVDWSRVELWWGDERFVAAVSEDRNAEPALAQLTGLGLSPDRVHVMPAQGPGLSLEEAAETYARELGDTVFDVCLLGLGPDAHVASLFPGHPQLRAGGRTTAVTDSPKPPPERISLTLETINASAEVWFLVSGSDKAAAVARSYGGDESAPGALVRGRTRTRWLLDRDAAEQLDQS